MNVEIRVPASTSNLGAGFDCLGMALDLWLTVRVRPGHGIELRGELAGLDPATDIITRDLPEEMLAAHRIDIESSIPVGRGLGSSGAATVAASTLELLASGQPATAPAVLERAVHLEGHPDNVAPAVLGGAVLIAGSEAVKLQVHPDVAIALAVPTQVVRTADARAVLPSQVALQTAVEQAARAAILVLGLERGDAELIGEGMQDLLAVPHRRALIRGLDQAIPAGIAAGAFGVTISGSGSTVLGLCPAGTENAVAGAMARALTEAGNPAVPLTPALSQTGMRIA